MPFILRRVCPLLAAASAALGVPSPAQATTTLTVDLSKTVRAATHVGSGSLYGVTETLPADVNGLIAPLHPNMFTNPAANVQQPWGDAFAVAARVAPLGATVTIRLADYFPGWYSFTNMTDWFSKMSQAVSRRKSANLTNIYAWEIWNEPNGTWKSDKPLSFNEFWRQSFVKLRSLDPGVKITGPSLAGYDANFMRDFLTFCKANDCLPDIAGWHEGEFISNNVQTYRALEKQLGIGPLPITMNEYSGYGQIKDEGRPGSAAPLIAQLERSGVETACITYWDVPHPGRLGSLLATNTDRNGGWFFYEWYGAMSGNMVATTSSLSVNGKNLDGVASLDATKGNAFVILGGINDGAVQIVVKGFEAASFLGSKVHAVVEHTPFGSRTAVVNATDTLSATDVTLQNDELRVTIQNTNGDDGYRLSLTPAGGFNAGTGGGAGVGGAGSGEGGSSGGGVTSAGGSGGTSTAGGASGGTAGNGTGGSAAPGEAGSASVGGSGGAASSGGPSPGPSIGGLGGDGAVPVGEANAGEGSCHCAMRGTHRAADARLASSWIALALVLARRRFRAFS